MQPKDIIINNQREIEILAVVPLANKLYAIIKPTTTFPTGEAIGKVFELVENCLSAVYDERIIAAVFSEYHKIQKGLND